MLDAHLDVGVRLQPLHPGHVFWVLGLGVSIRDLGFGVWGLGFWVLGLRLIGVWG